MIAGTSITQCANLGGRAYRRTVNYNYGQPIITYHVLTWRVFWRALDARVHRHVIARIDAGLASGEHWRARAARAHRRIIARVDAVLD